MTILGINIGFLCSSFSKFLKFSKDEFNFHFLRYFCTFHAFKKNTKKHLGSIDSYPLEQHKITRFITDASKWMNFFW